MAKYTVSINQPKQPELESTACRQDFLSSMVKQLIQRRQAVQKTQEEVDAIMGNADRSISKWESGHRTPSSFNLYCWALALDSQFILVENGNEDIYISCKTPIHTQ